MTKIMQAILDLLHTDQSGPGCFEGAHPYNANRALNFRFVVERNSEHGFMVKFAYCTCGENGDEPSRMGRVL